jgi:uncharacterized protein YjiS (DUF1127 family)
MASKLEANMWKRIVARWAYEVTAQRMEKMDDRLLADIGLDREEVRQRVMGVRAGVVADGPAVLPDGGWDMVRFRQEKPVACQKPVVDS